MQKERRSFFAKYGLGAAILLAVGLLLLLLLVPGVQRSILVLLDRHLDTVSIDVAALHVGPWGARIDNATLALPGLSLQAREVSVDIAFWSSLRERRLIIDEALGEAVQLSITRSGSAANDPGVEAEEQPQPFNGLADILRWPGRLVLRALQVNGFVTIVSPAPAPEASSLVTGSWSLSVADLAAGAQAALSLDTTLQSRRGEHLLGAVIAQLRGSAEVASNGVLAELVATLKLRPDLPGVEGAEPRSEPDRNALDVSMTLALGAEQETVTLNAVSARGRQVAQVDAVYERPDGKGSLSWQLALGPNLVAAFLAPNAHADLAGQSTGQAKLSMVRREVSLVGTLALQGEGWDWFDSRLRYLGAQQAQAEFAAAGWGQHWRVSRLVASGADEAQGRETVSLALLQPVSVDMTVPQLVAEQWGEPLLRLTARHLPLAWLRGFDSQHLFDSGFLGADLLVLAEDERTVAIKAERPLRLSELRLRQRSGEPLPVIAIAAEPHIQLRDGTLSARLDNLLLTADTGLDIRFRGHAYTSVATWPLVEFVGGVALRSPALRRRAPEVDAVRGMAEINLDLADLRLDVVRVALDAKAFNGDRLASLLIEGDAPLGISLATHAIAWDDFAPHRMALNFMGAPVAWLSAYLPEIDLAGGALYGVLEAKAGQGNGFELRARDGFAVRGIVPLYRGKRIARGLDLTLSPHIRLTNQGGRMVLDDMQLRSRQQDRVGATLALAWDTNPPRQLDLDLAIAGYLPSLTADVGQFGELRWQQRGVIDLPSRRIEVRQLNVEIDATSGAPLLRVSSLKPFLIANDPLGFAVHSGSQRVLKVTVTPLPLQRLLPRSQRFDIEGLLGRGEFYGRVDGQGRLVLSALEPLVFRGVNLDWQGTALFEQLQIALTYEVAYSVNGLEARSIDIKATNAEDEEVANVVMTAVAPLTQRRPLQALELEMQMNLAPISRQPVMDGIDEFNSGALLARLSLDNEARRRLQGELWMRDASATQAGRLPELSASLAVDAAPGRGVMVRMPVALHSARGHSDLAFEGTLAALGKRRRFEAGLVGKQIIVPDLLAFYDLVAKPGAEAPADDSLARARPRRSALQQLRQRRDAEPFWGQRFFGHAAINIERLQLADHAVEDVRAEAQLLRKQLSFYGLHARLLGGQLRANGRITYHHSHPSPYQFRYRMRAQDLHLAELLAPYYPGQQALAEGLFTLSSTLTAAGRNPLDTALNLHGEIALDGRNGVFRGLAGKGLTASKAANVVGTLTFSRQLRAIGRLLDDLNELSFSGLHLALVRDATPGLRLDKARLVTPLLRLRGSGEVTAARNATLAESHLQALLAVATRGDMSILFDGMGLLHEDPDRYGYRNVYRELGVTGTLAEPDFSDFWDLLDQAAGNARGSFGFGLRAVNRKLAKAARNN